MCPHKLYFDKRKEKKEKNVSNEDPLFEVYSLWLPNIIALYTVITCTRGTQSNSRTHLSYHYM